MSQTSDVFVIDSKDVENNIIQGSCAFSRITIDRRVGCQNLEQRIITVQVKGEFYLCNQNSEEVLFVVQRRADATVSNKTIRLTIDSALLIPPTQSCGVINAGRDALVMVSVRAPQPGPFDSNARTHAVRRENLGLRIGRGKDRNRR